MKAKKRIGTRAFKIILLHDYGINISEGRIYRLLKSMNLPKMSTTKPHFKSRKPTEPILFHSDQGSQFKSQEFRKLLDEHHLIPSYSKPGYPYDNAVTEVFFKYLKQREINRKTFHSIEEVRLSCFEYIEQFYNNYNPHSANNGLTPNQKKLEYFKN